MFLYRSGDMNHRQTGRQEEEGAEGEGGRGTIDSQ